MRGGQGGVGAKRLSTAEHPESKQLLEILENISGGAALQTSPPENTRRGLIAAGGSGSPPTATKSVSTPWLRRWTT